MLNNTIAAISTPPGSGGIGIVRLSGDNSKDIAEKIFKPKNKNKSIKAAKGYTGIYGHIIDEKNIIDEVICFIYDSPYSYTGEDVIEISAHGGIQVLKEILLLAVKHGAKYAQPGEFTKRAFLNNKIDLTKAEAVMDIISAKGKSARRAAVEAKNGALFKKIQHIKNMLLEILAYIAVFIDYPEEEIIDFDYNKASKDLKKCTKIIKDLLKTYNNFKINKNGLNIVITGKPNVGKSTLMNILTGSEKSIVTEIAGTTRDIISENILISGIPVNIYDTAGLRDTKDLIEKAGVEKAYNQLKFADIILAVFDISDELDKKDEELLNLYGTHEGFIAVINKTDLNQKLNDKKIKESVKNIIYISAKHEKNLNELSDLILKLIASEKFSPEDGVIANERQEQCVKDAIIHLNHALKANDSGETLDIISYCIENAIDVLMQLTGEKVTENVVDKIFHNFCVGK